ncbi:ABC transporter ATP-binding protein [Gallicola sp. Sow4_E12]|uniref:ABC transporter ATP-binding protein n=1 Tax=Gallicola sp. Sow4_E12 TaxID=3438785 RepID=UPI003F92AC33
MKEQKNLRPDNPVKTLKRLFSYFKYNKAMFFIGLLALIISTLCQTGANAIISPIIDSISDAGFSGDFFGYLRIMIILVILLAVTQYIGYRLMARLAQTTVHKIRHDLFDKMESLPISFFDTNSHGDLMSTYTNDVDMLNMALEQSAAQFVMAFFTVVGSFTMMFLLSPILTLIAIATLVFMFFIIRFIGSKSSKYFRAQQVQVASMNGYVEEMMSGQKVVKVFNYEDRAIDDFTNRNEELREAASKASAYGVMLMPIMGNLSYMQYAITAIVGALMVISGRLTVGNIAAFLQYTRTVSQPITMFSNQLNTLFAAIAGAERIFKIMDETPETDEGVVRICDDPEDQDKKLWCLPLGKNKDKKVPVTGHIEFKNVNFSYVPGKQILKNISLFAKPGQRIAFVGSTGAGKTTITNLINRFYEIDEGLILYDEIDIQKINKTDLRSTMSIVLQDVHLFKGTVRDNIRYGKLDATDEEIVEAAKIANAHYFIKHLPKGYDTELITDGQNLSQGERQLLSIARAAVADPTIIILDEATSSVDTRTEKLIQEGMEKLMEGRTTFVIAHRLSTVRNSNAIMVMENGEIIERGDHDDLMKQRGRYYALNTGQIELK